MVAGHVVPATVSGLSSKQNRARQLKRLPAQVVEATPLFNRFSRFGRTTTWQGQPTHAYSFDTHAMIDGAQVDAHTTLYLNQAGLIQGSESDNVKNGHKFRKVQKNTFDPEIHIEVPRTTQ